MTFHFRKIKETSSNVLVLSIINMLQVRRKQRLVRCVFKADGAAWLHTDKYTGQTKAEVWLVTLLNTHTHTRRWYFVVVALSRVKGGRFREPFSYFCQPNRSAQIRQRVEFFYFNPFTHWKKDQVAMNTWSINTLITAMHYMRVWQLRY